VPPDRAIDASFIALPAAFTVDGPRAASDAARIDAGAKLAINPNQPERLGVRELRWRVLTPQPKLRRQGRSQDELVTYKARVQGLQLNAVCCRALARYWHFATFRCDSPP
jgi:hypothetical protein